MWSSKVSLPLKRPKKGTNPESVSPKSACTFGEHIGVFNSDPKGMNFGIINVELDSCAHAVMFWPALKLKFYKSLKGYWWTAEDVIDMGQNKVVVGNKIHDVTYQHPAPDNPGNIIHYMSLVIHSNFFDVLKARRIMKHRSNSS